MECSNQLRIDDGSRTVQYETEELNNIRMRVLPASEGLQQVGGLFDNLIIVTKNLDFNHSFEQEPCTKTLLQPEQMIWIPAGNSFRLKAAVSKAEIIIIEIPPSEREHHRTVPRSNELLAKPRLGVPSQKATSILERMVRSFVESGEFGGQIMARSISMIGVNELLQTLISSPEPSQTHAALSQQQLECVFEFVEGNYHRKIGPREMAESTNLSQFHFSRAFTASTGLSPYKYVLNRRVEHAKRLMQTTQDSIAMIAFDVGFSSQSHLTEVFCRHAGTSPGKYRNKMMQEQEAS